MSGSGIYILAIHPRWKTIHSVPVAGPYLLNVIFIMPLSQALEMKGNVINAIYRSMEFSNEIAS